MLPTNCERRTDKSLSNITVTDNDIEKIIKGLDLSEAYGHEVISIHRLKLCGGSIYKPLRLIFRAFLHQESFPLCLKKTQRFSYL